ncbi:hypothetical protein FA09DRAFT_292905 [Tilletiopsis washingtonensis]|uniref:Uncharacterized protein n=1 Tax=Tilletiopsis washingtonensis TaxID=58919 RepID=A0A316ZIF0_9BASI|nr:hypothetical protein FA09DRAFT_292905 [Tilletiopsis washingtonensis]PWO01312.1 hypothetical protein FA09DRAFT_292905 [Tilletiopsis washingtonensis]
MLIRCPCQVRPPPSKQSNPLNLQIQLVTPSAAGGSGASRVASIISSRSQRSEASSGGVSSVSGSNARRVTPLYNLSFHTILPTVVTDAGTDQKVAKFSRKGVEIDGFGILEPHELRRESVTSTNAGSDVPQLVPGGGLTPDGLRHTEGYFWVIRKLTRRSDGEPPTDAALGADGQNAVLANVWRRFNVLNRAGIASVRHPPPSVADDDVGSDGEGSDPEDSETPWTCHLVLGPETRIPIASLAPAPHHPKLVGQLAIPFPLPDLSASALGADGAGLTREELKDIVCVTCFFLTIRESWNGLGLKRRKGEPAWKLAAAQRGL